MSQMDKKIVIIIAVVAVVAIAAAAALVLGSNGGGEQKEKETVTITDLAGREVSLQVPVERIVCGDAETMPLIAAIAGSNFKNMVVGYDNNIKTYYPDVQRMWESGGMDFSKMTSCGSFQDMNFNWETVVDLEPDVVFIPTWCYVYGMVSEQTVENMAKAGVPIVNLDIYMNKLDAATVKKDCDILGTIFDNKATADKVAAFYAEQLNKVDSKISQAPENSKVFYFELLNNYEVYGMNGSSTSGNSKMFLNQEPVVKTGNTPISPEAFLEADIDFAFLAAFSSAPCGKNIGWGATVTKADIESISDNMDKRPSWSESKVVQNGKVYVISTGPISTLDVWFLYQFMAQTMFPEVYGDLGAINSLKSFYTQFIPWIDFKGVYYFSLDGEDIGMIS